MKKYTILSSIIQASDGAAPTELSTRLGVALPNMYLYLRQLSEENLIFKRPDGKYEANKTNEKTGQVLELHAIAPKKFHILITNDFKSTLELLCKKLKVEQNHLSETDIKRIEKIAIPLRIVLRLSERPALYSLKLNEALVATLLSYHDLKSTFSRRDFQKMIEQLQPIKLVEEKTKPVKSDSEVAKMCDEFYASNGDDFISKVSNFIPDERIGGLLRAAEQTNKEYALFLNALDENTKMTMEDQWGKKYIYNTNSIEGNTMSQDDIDKFLNTGAQPSSVSKRELFETNNTADALAFLRMKSDEDVSEELAKELHFIIQKNIAERPGSYKNFYNYIHSNIQSNSPTTPPQHVKQRMTTLIDWYKKNRSVFPPVVLASIFHMQFEIIHPFADGNGRVGRLLMNHILVRNNHLPITILEKTKQNYYRALENRSLPQFLMYVLSSFIEEYKR